MSAMVPEIRPLFQYGLLASGVSMILAIYESNKDYQLTEGNKQIIEKARCYIDDILNSQQLVSGVRGNMAPSEHGLKAWKHALNSIPIICEDAVNSSIKRTDFFKTIKTVLEDVISKKKVEIDNEQLILANKFFNVVAKKYLKETEHKFKIESISTPL